MNAKSKDPDVGDMLLEIFESTPGWVFFLFMGFALTIGLFAVGPLAKLIGDLAWLFPLGLTIFVGVLGGIAQINKLKRRQLVKKQKTLEDLRQLSWREFEVMVGEAFRMQGYAVEDTGSGADHGVDLRLRGK